MDNVIFKFKRSPLQKFSLLLSVITVIDGRDTIKIAPDTEVEKNLDIGEHTIRSSIPYVGNELYVATTKINVQPNTRYEVVYKVSLFGTSKLSINII